MSGIRKTSSHPESHLRPRRAQSSSRHMVSQASLGKMKEFLGKEMGFEVNCLSEYMIFTECRFPFSRRSVPANMSPFCYIVGTDFWNETFSPFILISTKRSGFGENPPSRIGIIAVSQPQKRFDRLSPRVQWEDGWGHPDVSVWEKKKL